MVSTNESPKDQKATGETVIVLGTIVCWCTWGILGENLKLHANGGEKVEKAGDCFCKKRGGGGKALNDEKTRQTPTNDSLSQPRGFD